MNLNARWICVRESRDGMLRHAAWGGFCTLSLLICCASVTAQTDTTEYSIIAQFERMRSEPHPAQIHVRFGDNSVAASAIEATPRTVGIVIDTGPNQLSVLAEEKKLAIGLVNDLADGNTLFAVASTEPRSEPQPPSERGVATEFIRNLTPVGGARRTLPVYDCMALVMRQVSPAAGLRIIVFIGEGTGSGSTLRYPDLRTLAFSNQISFFCALVADHSTRGPRGMLRYGWSLRELANDTTGLFLDSEKPGRASRLLSAAIQQLRLIHFQFPPMKPGFFAPTVSDEHGKKLRSQKFVSIH
jgi:hypothetical protein